MAGFLSNRAGPQTLGDRTFRVPTAEDRPMISTLQRMYRHFYFRLCDIVDSTCFLESDIIDYDNLHTWASSSSIWEGVATYLVIVSDYVVQYRGKGLNLPSGVHNSAVVGGDRIYFGRGFLRVSILPSIGLYASELKTLLLQKQLASTARLSLLPCLATAAARGRQLTGSDKGIWVVFPYRLLPLTPQIIGYALRMSVP